MDTNKIISFEEKKETCEEYMGKNSALRQADGLEDFIDAMRASGIRVPAILD